MRTPELRIVWRAGGEDEPRVTAPAEAARFLDSRLAHEPVEVFAVLCLSTKHDPIAYHEVSRGCLGSTLVHPREVFKAAVLCNAAAIIVGHNHPSGDPHPSRMTSSSLSDSRLREHYWG